MPEMGRPISPQQAQYSQVQMGPSRSLGGKQKSEAQVREEIINKATGYKPKNDLYKEGAHNQMGKDEFLKLLTFQLQHQDPMNPMDQSKMTGELAQFSQLEQLTNLNKKFDEGNKSKGVEDKFYAASFVGKKVVTTGSTVELKNSGDPAELLFKLDDQASKVLVRILDEKNNIVGEIWKEGMSEGSHQVTWDGIALDGAPAVKGTYRAQVKAWDENANAVIARTETTGVVQSVTFDEGEPVLTVGGQKVYLRDVKSFHTADTNLNALSAEGSLQNGATLAEINAAANKAAQATNSGLSDHAAPVQLKNTTSPAQAANAYTENTGIYE